ncbi:MAG: hypothetical protein U0787_21265 [Polyangia bacterium]
MKRAGHILLLLAVLSCAQVVPTGDPPRDPDIPCSGLRCNVTRCGNGQETRLRGQVTVPNGLDPVGKAVVYVPESEPLPPCLPICLASCVAIQSLANQSDVCLFRKRCRF